MKTSTPENATIINASNLIAGRMASIIAKRLLNGEKIVVINAEKAILSGRKSSRLKEFKAFLEIVGRANPKYGPKHYRSPNAILRKMIQGMLPQDKAKGRNAYKNLKVFTGSPLNITGKEAQTLNEASVSKSAYSYVSLGTIAKEIGWKEVAG